MSRPRQSSEADPAGCTGAPCALGLRPASEPQSTDPGRDGIRTTAAPGPRPPRLPKKHLGQTNGCEGSATLGHRRHRHLPMRAGPLTSQVLR